MSDGEDYADYVRQCAEDDWIDHIHGRCDPGCRYCDPPTVKAEKRLRRDTTGGQR
jgi:hypothetical protein